MSNKKKNPVAIAKMLDRKRVQIVSGVQGTASIDISKCTELGNKSWGAIEALSKIYDAPIVGTFDYRTHCEKAYYDKGSTSISKSRTVVKDQNRIYSGHSYDSVPKLLNNGGKGNKNQTVSSEFSHLEAIYALQEKFNNHVFTKSDEDKSKLLNIKAKGVTFSNELLYQHSTVKPLKQLSTAEKKSRRCKSVQNLKIK